jgi:NAD(P)-dependent dehydrogenase (short-subunit alcohol dehydrogenase family)
VVGAARRLPQLDGGGGGGGEPGHPLRALSLTCDVTDAEACRSVVAAAATFLEPFGGLDTVVYAAGSAPLGPVTTTTSAQWHDLLATNLVGAALIGAAAVPHLLRQPGGTLVLLSSHSVGEPWPGLVPYAASKGGLDQLALGLRAEEPSVRFLRIAVGPTATSFADGWTPEVAGPWFERWAALGHLRHAVLEPDETAAAIVAALDDPGGGDDLRVTGAEEGPAA